MAKLAQHRAQHGMAGGDRRHLAGGEVAIDVTTTREPT
jgi:hypothetical protein